MQKVAVIGAGPMGLASALELLKSGHEVDVYEADDRIGGMSAHFDFNGLSIERFYHFICKPDQATFDMLDELDIAHKLKWTPTRMGYYFKGKHYDWGNPSALLKFKPLGIWSRLRYGIHMFYCTKINKWKHLDSVEASDWIRRWEGDKAYNVLWKNLFKLKFHDFSQNLSAAWIWSRIKRVGLSRKSLFQEEMGYIDGGSEVLLNALACKIKDKGGNIYLSQSVAEVIHDGDAVEGVVINGAKKQYDSVVSTIPLPFVPKLIPTLSVQRIEKYRSLENIAVICVLFKLKRPVTHNFWLNVSDERMEIPGIIEMSNLQKFNHSLVYVPFYMPQTHSKFNKSNEDMIAEAKSYLKILNPELIEADFIDSHASRYAFAQPICPPDFEKKLPDMKTEIDGLYIVDTSYYYPEDRSISESFRVGQEVARLVP